MNFFEKHLRKLEVETTTLVLVATLVLGGVGTSLYTNAAATPTFNQTINAGTLSTDIRDASRVTVGSPAVAMGAKTFSFDCLSGGSAATGTLGSASERIYVDNPDAADNGWTLAIAATGGATSTWSDGGSNTYDFNDSSGSGCTDGADADSKGGQMTINPSVGSTTTDYSGSDTTGITLGNSTAFVQGTTDSVTLVTAANTSADIWRGYFTGVTVSQTIPAEQTAAAYTLQFTITVSAS
ncbi:hypothetical protein HYV44_02400 [Candidatus Microgenomates bacterium]|nr:hypothetical protein [Candidatus Microgenomates bacterium]